MKKNFTISVSWKRLFVVVLPAAVVACALGLLAGVVVVDRLVMPSIVGVNKGIITVPSVVDLGVEQARDNLLGAGLLCQIREREFNETVAEGRVIRQEPVVGTRVKKGRRVDIFVSRGTAIGVVPPLVGVSERQARIILRQQGFTIGRVRHVYSEDEPEEIIVRCNPLSGSKVSKEIEMELFVSDGPRPTHAEMPNLVGETVGAARQGVEDIGLVIGKVEYANNPSLVPGTVMSQSVPPGTRVPLESGVNIVVSIMRE